MFQSSKKKKKKPFWKNILYLVKWNFLALSLKNFLYFRRVLAKPENQKFNFFGLLWENFSIWAQKKEVSYSSPYKGEKSSKLKYFLIIITKRFFSFYIIFSYTQQAFAFHLLRDFCNVHNHISLFFLFFL